MRVLFALLACLACSPAHADDASVAKEHYRKGMSAYEVGDFNEAIREFAAAYKLRNDPVILFNLGQSQRHAGHTQDALRSFRMYLSRAPAAADRANVERLISELQAGIEPPRVEDPDTERARAHFRAGVDHYAATQYEAAIREFEAGRKLRPSAAFDFNIGRSADRLGKVQEAIASYQRYASASPTPSDADEVRQRIEVLKRRRVSETPAPPPAAAPRARDRAAEAAGRKKWVAGLAVGAVGVAGVALGIGFAVLARSDNDELSHPAPGERFDPALEDQMKRNQALAASFFAVGGAALVAGTVLAVLGRRQERAARVAFAPALGRDRIAVALRLAF